MPEGTPTIQTPMANRQPLVSVIIPTYNRREPLTEAVASVLAQSHAALELIVVDDGSDDGTAAFLAERFNDARLRLISQENLGVSAARNRGAREASGDWLAFLDSDDSWLPEKLERQLAVTLARPDCPVSYTEEIWYRHGRWANPRNVHAKQDGWIFEQCLALCIISPSSVMMRRDVWDELGGFDESLVACEDYDLWLRLSVRYPVCLVDEKLIIKRNGHEGQLSQLHFALDRFRVRALWKIALDETLERDPRRKALEWIVKKAHVVALGAAKRGAEQRARVFRYSVKEAQDWLERWND